MWITYKRILEGNQWIHPDFANDGRTSEKYLSPNDNTLFLANTIKTEFVDEMVINTTTTNIDGVDVETNDVVNKTNYARFDITEIPENMVKIKKQEFKIGRIITKGEFISRMTFEEQQRVCDYTRFLLGEENADKCSAMRTLWRIFDNFIMLNLDDDRFIANFVQIVAWTGLISQERILEIIA